MCVEQRHGPSHKTCSGANTPPTADAADKRVCCCCSLCKLLRHSPQRPSKTVYATTYTHSRHNTQQPAFQQPQPTTISKNPQSTAKAAATRRLLCTLLRHDDSSTSPDSSKPGCMPLSRAQNVPPTFASRHPAMSTRAICKCHMSEHKHSFRFLL